MLQHGSSADFGGVQMTRLGFEPSDIAVVKQLVDVMYAPLSVASACRLSLCLLQLPVISPPKSFDLVMQVHTQRPAVCQSRSWPGVAH